MARDDREIRKLTLPVTVKRAKTGDGVKVEGYAAVFNEETNVADYFREVIKPGAFTETLKRGDDVVFVINHDGLPLARTKSGTLKLKQDKRGLHMSAELDAADPDVMRVVPKMERGDLTEMSFAFLPTKQRWIEPGDDDDLTLREIEAADLFDVSIVTNGQYSGTEIGLRALQAHQGKTSNSERLRRMRMKSKLGPSPAMLKE